MSSKEKLMDVSNMRLLHRWISTAVCPLLTVLRWLRDLQRSKISREPERIVFVKLAEQGATVLAYPALRLAAERVGSHNLFAVVFAENRFILDLLNVIPQDNVIAI